MNKKESQADKAQKSVLPNLIPPEFAAMGKERLQQFTALQSELFTMLQELNQHWLDRMQSEAALASEFATKLSAAHSIPETATVCQEWAAKRMEMAAEDAKRLIADGQKFAETGARLLSSGSSSNGHGGSK